MSKIPTPHITAKKEDFAQTVLMPGDPLRAIHSRNIFRRCSACKQRKRRAGIYRHI